MTRKRRTRHHVLEDLSHNHLERYVLHCGYTLEPIAHDYGTDVTIITYDANGEIENGYIWVQVKATDRLNLVRSGTAISFDIQRSDLETWLGEPMPVILILYDATNDAAYWLYIQQYFARMPGFDLASVNKSIAVHLPLTNTVDSTSVRQFREFRDNVLKQVREVIRHG